MKRNSFTLNKFWLECLNTESVKCWSTVKKHRVSFQNILQNIPYYRLFAIYYFLVRFHSLYNTTFYHLTDNKRLVKLGCHIFWNSTFVQFQVWPNHNYRTS